MDAGYLSVSEPRLIPEHSILLDECCVRSGIAAELANGTIGLAPIRHMGNPPAPVARTLVLEPSGVRCPGSMNQPLEGQSAVVTKRQESALKLCRARDIGHPPLIGQLIQQIARGYFEKGQITL